MAIDGSCLDVTDTEAKEIAFGRPGSAREGQAGLPQLRLVGLAECGTHAIVAAVMGPYRGPERELVRRLLPALQPGMLCLADRGLYSFQLWQQAQAQGAALLWRIHANLRLEVSHPFADGSYLPQAHDSADRRREQGMTVRLIDYVLDDPGRPNSGHYRLLTNLLAPDQAPARELAALYAQRWEFETTLDELKIHQRGPRVVLRSNFPEGVYQEAYGYLLTHYAIRVLMHDAAVEAGLDPVPLTGCASIRPGRRPASTQSLRCSPPCSSPFAYAVVRLLLETLAIHPRPNAGLRAEVLAFRHQVRVLERQVGRPRWQPADRVLLAAISQALPRPETLALVTGTSSHVKRLLRSWPRTLPAILRQTCHTDIGRRFRWVPPTAHRR